MAANNIVQELQNLQDSGDNLEDLSQLINKDGSSQINDNVKAYF